MIRVQGKQYNIRECIEEDISIHYSYVKANLKGKIDETSYKDNMRKSVREGLALTIETSTGEYIGAMYSFPFENIWYGAYFYFTTHSHRVSIAMINYYYKLHKGHIIRFFPAEGESPMYLAYITDKSSIRSYHNGEEVYVYSRVDDVIKKTDKILKGA